MTYATGDRVVVSPNCRASRHIGKDGTVVSVGRQIEIQLYSDELVKVNRNELHKASPVSSPRNDQELEFQLAEDSVDYISELAASHARLPGSLSENLNRLATECATSQFASPLGLAPPVEAAPVRELNDGATGGPTLLASGGGQETGGAALGGEDSAAEAEPPRDSSRGFRVAQRDTRPLPPVAKLARAAGAGGGRQGSGAQPAGSGGSPEPSRRRWTAPPPPQSQTACTLPPSPPPPSPSPSPCPP